MTIMIKMELLNDPPVRIPRKCQERYSIRVLSTVDNN